MKSFKKIIALISLFTFHNILPGLTETKQQLLIAAENGKVNEVKKLLEIVPINSSLNVRGDTALHIACQHKQTNLAIELINLGANVNLKNHKNSTPLHLATMSNSIKIIELLVKSGANINAQDQDNFSALHFSIKHNDISLVKYLLENNADPNIQDREGLTPFFWSVLTINPEKTQNDQGKKSYITKKFLIISLFINSPLINVNIQNKEKETVLMQACKSYRSMISGDNLERSELLKIFKILIESNIDLSLKDKEENNIFDILNQEKKKNFAMQDLLKEVEVLLHKKNNARLIIAESKLKKIEKLFRSLILTESRLAEFQLLEELSRNLIDTESNSELDTQYNNLLQETTARIIDVQEQEEKDLLSNEILKRRALEESEIQELFLFLKEKQLIFQYFEDLKKISDEFKKELNNATQKFPCPHGYSNFKCAFICNNKTATHKK